jgi:hypothetical protein
MPKNKELLTIAQLFMKLRGKYEIRHFLVGLLESKKGPVYVLCINAGIFLLLFCLNNVRPFSNCTYFF